MGYMNHWKRVIGCFLIGGMALTTVGCGGTPAGEEGPSNAAASTSSITDSTADIAQGEPTSTVSANSTGSTGSSSALTTGAAPGVSKAPAGTVPTEEKATAATTTVPTTASPFHLTDEQWAVIEDFHEAIRRTKALKQIHYRTHTTTLYQNENGEKTTYRKIERWIQAGERYCEEEEYLMNMNPVRTYRRYNEPNISYYTSTDQHIRETNGRVAGLTLYVIISSFFLAICRILMGCPERTGCTGMISLIFRRITALTPFAIGRPAPMARRAPSIGFCCRIHLRIR